jgi:hypothetical protein
MQNDTILLSARGVAPAVHGRDMPGAPRAESEDGVDDHLLVDVVVLVVLSAGFWLSSFKPRALTPASSSSWEIGA